MEFTGNASVCVNWWSSREKRGRDGSLYSNEGLGDLPGAMNDTVVLGTVPRAKGNGGYCVILLTGGLFFFSCGPRVGGHTGPPRTPPLAGEERLGGGGR